MLSRREIYISVSQTLRLYPDRKIIYNASSNFALYASESSVLVVSETFLKRTLIIRHYPIVQIPNILRTSILWELATMSDATLPPRSSSAEPVEDMANGSDLTLPGSNPDTLREDDYVSTTREDGSGDSAGGTDNKQKRKRTRYVGSCAPLSSLFRWDSDPDIHKCQELGNTANNHCL